MLFSADSIHVKRLEPYPSSFMTLPEAADMGFSLVGTGSEDYVIAECDPDEEWSLEVRDSLGIISPQDDVADGVDAYSDPAVIKQLVYLDSIQESLYEMIPRHSLLDSLFGQCRREISWLLPSASDPPSIVRDHLENFCLLLFKDERAQKMWDWFAGHARMHTEAVVFSILRYSLKTLDITPSEDAILSLARGICQNLDLCDAIEQCVDSISSNARCYGLSDHIATFAEAITRGINHARGTISRFSMSPDDRAKTMNLLFETAGLERLGYSWFPDALSQPMCLGTLVVAGYSDALFLKRYCSAFLRGDQATVDRFHAELSAIG